MSASTSTTATATSTSSSPSSSSSPNGNHNTGDSTNQGNLYLFTFLSTLLVLLLISCSIVFRSFVLRRRYQRRLADALASGAILAPRTQGSRRKRFKIRPKFFDTWVSDTDNLAWSDLMPVSVLPFKTKKKTKESEENGTPARRQRDTVLQRLASSHFMTRDPRTSRSRFWRRVLDDHSDPPSPVSPTSPEAVTPVHENPDPFGTPQKNLVQVAVLVAMPSPNRGRQSPIAPQDEENLPELVFGVTRLQYKTSSS